MINKSVKHVNTSQNNPKSYTVHDTVVEESLCLVLFHPNRGGGAPITQIFATYKCTNFWLKRLSYNCRIWQNDQDPTGRHNEYRRLTSMTTCPRLMQGADPRAQIIFTPAILCVTTYSLFLETWPITLTAGRHRRRKKLQTTIICRTSVRVIHGAIKTFPHGFRRNLMGVVGLATR